MIAPIFVDTNVLVYAEDLDSGAKHETARGLVLDLWDSAEGVLSIQVLQEYFVTVTRKMKQLMETRQALDAVGQYLTWECVENTGPLLLAAIRLADTARLSFWDAIIVQAAKAAGCRTLLTEDLNHGQYFGDLQVVNPFA